MFINNISIYHSYLLYHFFLRETEKSQEKERKKFWVIKRRFRLYTNIIICNYYNFLKNLSKLYIS